MSFSEQCVWRNAAREKRMSRHFPVFPPLLQAAPSPRAGRPAQSFLKWSTVRQYGTGSVLTGKCVKGLNVDLGSGCPCVLALECCGCNSQRLLWLQSSPPVYPTASAVSPWDLVRRECHVTIASVYTDCQPFSLWSPDPPSSVFCDLKLSCPSGEGGNAKFCAQ